MAQPSQASQGVAQGVAHSPVVEEDHAPQGGEAAHSPAVEVVQPPRANPPVVEVPPSVIVNNPSAINKDSLRYKSFQVKTMLQKTPTIILKESVVILIKH